MSREVRPGLDIQMILEHQAEGDVVNQMPGPSEKGKQRRRPGSRVPGSPRGPVSPTDDMEGW